MGLNSSRPNMVMARLSDGEKCCRLATAVRNCVIAAGSKPGAIGSHTRTLAYLVSHKSPAAGEGVKTDLSSQFEKEMSEKFLFLGPVTGKGEAFMRNPFPR